MKSILYFLLFFFPLTGFAQEGESEKPTYQWGLHHLSIAATNLQYGLPFIRLAPLHPGGEVGLTILKKSGPKWEQGAKVQLGYFHHLLAAAPYLNAQYYLQYNIKDVVGVKANAGVGYAHVFYPGDGYRYEESSGGFETVTVHSPYFMATVGTGISYLKWKKVQPFVDYEVWLLGSTSIFTTSFKVGVNLPF